MKQATQDIRLELKGRLEELRAEHKLLEAQRLEQRTLYDLELLEEMGFCPGIENYSRHLTGREPGEPPPTLHGLSEPIPAFHRRESRHRASNRRYVSRRPIQERNSRRVRLPFALGFGQSPLEFFRVRGVLGPGRLCFRYAGPV
jgi:hypothetical protein